MSLTSINDFSNDMKAAMSPAADAPIVPANATIVAFSPMTSLCLTITSHFANERGEQNDNAPELGLKIYGLSFCVSPSMYDAMTRGNMDTNARTTREIPLAVAHVNHSSAVGLAMRTIHTRLPAWASIESPTPSLALFDVAMITDPAGSGLSPTIFSNIMRVKITCKSLGDFINSSSKIILGLSLSSLNNSAT